MADESSWARRLRRLPALAGDLPSFDPAHAPAEPLQLFLRWLQEAIDEGVAEPHALTVATVAPDGTPSSRVVVLKDAGEGGLSFATDARSGKARDLTVNPVAALSFYWQPVGRQVRFVGRARPTSAAESAADFLARSPASRAAALATSPGEPLDDLGQLTEALAAARAQVEAVPDVVLPQWQLILVEPYEAEFWQGRADRTHVRVQYARADDGTWSHRLVQP